MSNDKPRMTLPGLVLVGAVVAVCLVGAYWLMHRGDAGAPQAGRSSPIPDVDISHDHVEIGVAYGTEKKRWMEWAVQEFAKTPEGANVKVTLIPKGSIEASHAIVAGDKTINVWSP